MQAERLFRRALAVDPFHPAANDNLMQLLLDMGRAKQAAALRRSVCIDHPNEPRAWMELARVLRGGRRGRIGAGDGGGARPCSGGGALPAGRLRATQAGLAAGDAALSPGRAFGAGPGGAANGAGARRPEIRRRPSRPGRVRCAAGAQQVRPGRHRLPDPRPAAVRRGCAGRVAERPRCARHDRLAGPSSQPIWPRWRRSYARSGIVFSHPRARACVAARRPGTSCLQNDHPRYRRSGQGWTQPSRSIWQAGCGTPHTRSSQRIPKR